MASERVEKLNSFIPSLIDLEMHQAHSKAAIRDFIPRNAPIGVVSTNNANNNGNINNNASNINNNSNESEIDSGADMYNGGDDEEEEEEEEEEDDDVSTQPGMIDDDNSDDNNSLGEMLETRGFSMATAIN